MRISARVANHADRHDVTLSTEGREQKLAVPSKAAGRGSAASGGELMCLALATCYCNDVYREAAARGIVIHEVEVEVEAEFGAAGEPARQVRYHVRISGEEDGAALDALARHTDTVAEVQNTVRRGVAVELVDVRVSSTRANGIT
jgi:organic hydroperoxide reductase OsmC/OhrA